MSVLSISDIKRYSTTLHFAREKREVYLVSCDKKRVVINGADERFELVELLICECGSPKSNRSNSFVAMDPSTGILPVQPSLTF